MVFHIQSPQASGKHSGAGNPLLLGQQTDWFTVQGKFKLLQHSVNGKTSFVSNTIPLGHIYQSKTSFM